MATPRILPTLPMYSRNVTVYIVSVNMDMMEDAFEAYAEIEEKPTYDPSYTLLSSCRMFDSPKGRTGKVRLTVDALNELGRSSNYVYQVEESHVEWDV